MTPPSLPAYYIGLMTGTSLDGIDAVLVDFAAPMPRLLASHGVPYPAELRSALFALQASGDDELQRAAQAANAHSQACALAVQQLLAKSGIAAAQIVAIGNHGQTIRHRPELGFTLQIGNHALLAELTGIDVIGDFRSRDVAAGGQGAPLVPAFHHALFGDAAHSRVLLNIGGIANLSVLPPDGAVSGWDCGPGNVLMDLWIQRQQGLPYDADGAWAATGRVLPDLLAALLAEPWFALPAPKSTGRDLFHAAWLDRHLLGRNDAAADVQATLCQLTAQTCADAIRPAAPAAVYVCGGGAHNRALLNALQNLLPNIPIASTAALGVDPDWVEAYAFAWLAQRFTARLPANLPAVTGARGLRVLGALYPK